MKRFTSALLQRFSLFLYKPNCNGHLFLLQSLCEDSSFWTNPKTIVNVIIFSYYLQ